MKRLLIVVIAIAAVFALSYGLLVLSRSRTYQLFGEIVPRVDTPQKVVALTFDDGPTSHAREVLDVLGAKNVKATFFLMGAEMKNDPGDAQRIAAAGHEIGNHTWSHPRMVFKTQSTIAREIERTDELIRQAGYRGEIYFRPPFGKKLVGLPWYLAQHHRTTITWDVEPNSYPEIDRSAERTVAYVLDRTRPGSIILLHPMYNGREATRAAIGPIIDGLHAKGYAFVTVDQLLRLRR